MGFNVAQLENSENPLRGFSELLDQCDQDPALPVLLTHAEPLQKVACDFLQ
jgi:hypothetical protein